MKKIPTVFVRNPDEMSRVTGDVNPGCEWVLAGEGRATRKWDGTCVMLSEDGHWWARREVKPGKRMPEGFVQVDHDPVTDKRVGWEPVEHSGFAKWFTDALSRTPPWPRENGVPFYRPGTYELIGPKINGNPDGAPHHTLIPHGRVGSGDTLVGGERTRGSIEQDVTRLADLGIEGIVYWHDDGRMAKIKGKDYGVKVRQPR